jgi:tRNA G18 (ribose-2'-O)-methylase SpoU
MKEIVVVLHNIRSLHNVGSIFRTADAAGVKKIYLCGITPAPVDRFGRIRPQLAKVSLDAEKYLAWEQVKSVSRLLDKLKCDGYKIFAIEQSKNSISYYKIKTRDAMTRHSALRVALVLGNEIKGLPSSILRRADKILEIPIHGQKESLNVAVAFGVVIFGIIYNK